MKVARSPSFRAMTLLLSIRMPRVSVLLRASSTTSVAARPVPGSASAANKSDIDTTIFIMLDLSTRHVVLISEALSAGVRHAITYQYKGCPEKRM